MKNKQQDEQKLLELFYSDESANDLLLFEIVKQMEDKEFSISMLTSLILATKSPAFKKEVYKYICDNFPKKYHLGFRLIALKRYIPSAIQHLLSLLKPAFSKLEILEFFYRIIKRRGEGHDIFLIVDQGEHPKRKEVFQDFIKKDNTGALHLPGLFRDEIIEYAPIFFQRKAKNESFTISLNSLKSPEIPDIIFSNKYDLLNYRNDFSENNIEAFPDFIFQFKGLTKLTMQLHSDVNIPKDWSSLVKLKIISFSKSEYVFQNIDFLDTIPNLKYVSNMMFGKSELFLQKKHLEIYSSDLPEKMRNKQRVILPSEIISQLGNDLKKSELPENRQHYFFEKLLIQKLEKFSEEEIEELSTVDFDRKVKRYFYRVMKQRFGPRLTEK